jgi:hypothetical protein
MFSVKIQKECGCVKKSGIQNNQKFTTKDAALMEAMALSRKMNEEFCQKHEFKVVEEGDNILITVDERQKRSCCGGGHCS